MNNDLISREAAVQLLRDKAGGYTVSMFLTSSDCNLARVVATECAVDIKNLPAVDAEPVQHGRWGTRVEVHGDPYDDSLWEEVIAQCSECGREVYLDADECVLGNVRKELAKYPYCHCGAKMDGDTRCDSSKV